MNKKWKVLFEVEKGTPATAQAVYYALLHAALTYRYGATGLAAVPINQESLTEAVFGISDQDTVVVVFDGIKRSISGKDLKELLIASIYLKYLEGNSRYEEGTNFFVVQPTEPGPVDVGIMVSKPGLVSTQTERTARLSDDHEPHLLQIKEYYDYQKTRAGLTTPETIDMAKLNELAGDYKDEITVIYLRMLLSITNADLKEFFAAHPTSLLIGTPAGHEVTFTSPEGVEKPIKLPQEKTNYFLTLPGDIVAVVSFDPPPFLIPRRKI